MAVTVPFRPPQPVAPEPIIDTLITPTDTTIVVREAVAELPPYAYTSLSDWASYDDPLTAPLYRTVEGRELFGPHSVQAEIPMGERTLHPVTEEPAYSFLVLTLVVLFVLTLSQYTGDVRFLMGRLFMDRGSTERLVEGRNSTDRVLSILGVLGMFLLGATIVRFADPMLPEAWASWLPGWMGLLASIAVTGALYLVVLYQRVVLSAVSALTYSQAVVGHLYQIKRSIFSIATLIAAPFLGLVLLSPRGMGEVWLWVIIIELFILAFLYLYESLMLFISKKISLLHWILYLCTVEILPFATILIAFTR